MDQRGKTRGSLVASECQQLSVAKSGELGDRRKMEKKANGDEMSRRPREKFVTKPIKQSDELLSLVPHLTGRASCCAPVSWPL